MIRTIAFAAALAAVAFAAGAHAQDRTVAHVAVQDANLNTPADAQKVYAQLTLAAQKVCSASGHEVFASDEAERMDLCVRDTLANAVAQSHSTLLAAMNGQAVPTVRYAGR